MLFYHLSQCHRFSCTQAALLPSMRTYPVRMLIPVPAQIEEKKTSSSMCKPSEPRYCGPKPLPRHLGIVSPIVLLYGAVVATPKPCSRAACMSRVCVSRTDFAHDLAELVQISRPVGDGSTHRVYVQKARSQLIVSKQVEHRRAVNPTVPSSPGDRQSLRIVTKKLSPSIGELFKIAGS